MGPAVVQPENAPPSRCGTREPVAGQIDSVLRRINLDHVTLFNYDGRERQR